MKPYIIIFFITASLISAKASALSAEEKIRVPFQYGLGKNLFEKNCSSCHGVDAKGTDKGPPLLHRIYEPSHHGDESFYRAALNGVKSHHWKFGDMLPVPGVERRDVSKILPYIRWLQRQHGIN
jgi:cytochrome c2